MRTAKDMVEQSLDNLYKMINKEKLESATQKIDSLINEKSKEGLFQCIITNDVLEDLFLDENEQCFDDTILLYIINSLRLNGFEVKYEEIIYDNTSNLIEISW